jgi:hypothetical protein
MGLLDKVKHAATVTTVDGASAKLKTMSSGPTQIQTAIQKGEVLPTEDGGWVNMALVTRFRFDD